MSHAPGASGLAATKVHGWILPVGARAAAWRDPPPGEKHPSKAGVCSLFWSGKRSAAVLLCVGAESGTVKGARGAEVKQSLWVGEGGTGEVRWGQEGQAGS